MNKTELKNFAVSARRDLLEKVALRAKIFGIDEKTGLTIEEQFGQLAINGNTYPLYMKSAFQSLSKQLEAKGYEQLIEEAAYTWFNRIIAIRYMEVHDYLPERVNVLSSSTGKMEPDIFSQFETMDLDIDTAEVKDLARQGETEKAYRKLFIAQCNVLYRILPFLFEKIHDYTELLLPDFLLDSESVIKKLVNNEALTESFKEVEVIGWLYQFYNSELKNQVLEGLKKSKKVIKDTLPAATQLFTPKWIVKYMVENSLGKLWLENNPNSLVKEKMEFYIKPKNKVEKNELQNINIEEVKILDPCCGSGHILIYTFDLLYELYEEAGYPTNEIPLLILKNNLYGLDIDERAGQLASFSLLMKARSKLRSIFKKGILPNISVIEETNKLNRLQLAELLFDKDVELHNALSNFLLEYTDAKLFGSLIKTSHYPIETFKSRIEELENSSEMNLFNVDAFQSLDYLKKIIIQHKLLNEKYDVLITNPPYIGSKGMDSKLSGFVSKYYSDSKFDIYACFIQRLFDLGTKNALIALVTPFTWMFLKSFEKLRDEIVNKKDIISLIQLEYNAFEVAMVPVCTFVLSNSQKDAWGDFIKLSSFKGAENQPIKTLEAIRNPYVDYRFSIQTKRFKDIIGTPIAYWASTKLRTIFKSFDKLGRVAKPCQGMSTADTKRFLKLWFEVSKTTIGYDISSAAEAMSSTKKWFPYNKGGSFRKWYGNFEYVVNWKNNGEEIKSFPKSVVRNPSFYFKKGITWSDLTSGGFSARYVPQGFLFDTSGPTMFTNDEKELEVIAYVNSSVFQNFLNLTLSGLHYNNGVISNLPYSSPITTNSVEILSGNNIMVSKLDWNSFETSWDFQRHPLLTYREDNTLLSGAFENWTNHTEVQFTRVKANEEELNRIFIDLYDLQDELTPEVPDEEITIRKADRVRDAKSLLSYFIGCVMGRYSLDIDGLVFAGGEWDELNYRTFKPNKHGLMLLTGEHYFEDDVIARLREFLTVTFGAEMVEENLQWLAESLELKRNETAEERLRRYFLEEFFKDHCQVYQKRPIYWLVDSGKQKGLRTLIYMHRYQRDTMATIRFEHLQEIQSKYNNEIAAVDLRVVNPNLSATEKRELEKRKAVYQKRLAELLEFDKKLAEYANAQITIDLDDGVNVNYEKFDGVLSQIK